MVLLSLALGKASYCSFPVIVIVLILLLRGTKAAQRETVNLIHTESPFRASDSCKLLYNSSTTTNLANGYEGMANSRKVANRLYFKE